MSYDLHFFADKFEGNPRDSFFAYFRNRARWKVDEDHNQAIYENEDTGSYFMAEYAALSGEDRDDLRYPQVLFNVNYYRPPFFGREAAVEIKAFSEFFQFDFFDPQTNGMGEGSSGQISIDGILRGWDHGNAFGYSLFSRQCPDEPPILAPEKKIMDAWRWNFEAKPMLNAYFEANNADVFVAKALWMVKNGQPILAAVWSDGCRTALPPLVDRVVLYADEIRSRRSVLRRIFSRRTEPQILECSPSDIYALNCVRPERAAGHDFILIESDVSAPAKEVRQFYFRPHSKIESPNCQVVSNDVVLSQDIMARAASA